MFGSGPAATLNRNSDQKNRGSDLSLREVPSLIAWTARSTTKPPFKRGWGIPQTRVELIRAFGAFVAKGEVANGGGSRERKIGDRVSTRKRSRKLWRTKGWKGCKST